MRKKIVTLLFTLCAFVTLLATSLLCACAPESNTTGGDNLSGTATVVIQKNSSSEAKTYTVDLSTYTTSSSVASVLVSLSQTTDLYYIGTNSQYGIMLTEMGTSSQQTVNGYLTEVDTPIIKQDNTTFTYIYVYTSVEKDKSSYDTVTKTYNDVTLYASNYGVSGMTLQDGAIYYFTEIVYTY
jgi:hypothetical protein